MSGYFPNTNTKTIPMTVDEFLYTYLEEMKTIPIVMGRRYHHKEPIDNTLTRTWRRFKTPPFTDAVMTMSKRNYKYYANIGTSKMITIRTLLYYSPAPDLISCAEVTCRAQMCTLSSISTHSLVTRIVAH